MDKNQKIVAGLTLAAFAVSGNQIAGDLIGYIFLLRKQNAELTSQIAAGSR